MSIVNSKVVIASVLKPLDDHRLDEKWGRYFKTQHHADVHIFGQSLDQKKTRNQPFHISLYQNTLRSRFKAQFRFLKLLFKIKPTLTILCTFELILPSLVYWITSFGKCRFHYDVRENYRLNIQSQNHYSNFQKIIFGSLVRSNEAISRIFVWHYFYTEPIYKDQLRFLNQGNSTYLPNYFSYNDVLEYADMNADITFLICGTLSKEYGTMKGLEWFREIKKTSKQDVKLRVVGHLTDPSIENELKKAEEGDQNVRPKPVPHPLILSEILNADYLLLPYYWTDSFRGCTPTKLYEALALGTPIILQNSPHLKSFQGNNLVHFIETKEDLNHFELRKKRTRTISEEFDFRTLYERLDLIFIE